MSEICKCIRRFEDRYKNLAYCIGATGKFRLFPCLYRVEEKQILFDIDDFIGKTDKVCLDLTALFS